MGAAAAREAVSSADIAPHELDAVIAVGSVPIQAIPCTAVFLQRELGLSELGIPAFDVNATCLGFLVALDLVAQSIATGRFRRVLIVASELAAAGVDPDDPLTAGLFGDGAAAIVVGASTQSDCRLLATELRTYSDGAEYCQVRAGGTQLHPRVDLEAFLGGTYFEMQGRATYRMAAERYPEFIACLCRRADVRVADVDVWVPHQASGKAIEHLADALNIPRDRMVLTLETHGNQISASIPAALHAAVTKRRIVRREPSCPPRQWRRAFIRRRHSQVLAFEGRRTGATGFIGSHVAESLARAGHQVVAGGRNQKALERLTALGCIPITADLTGEPLLPLVKGCEAIVHCAALASPWGERAAFWHHNVVATERLIAAACNVRFRFVHTSPSIYFSWRDQLNRGEAFEPRACWPTHYAETKWISECRVQEARDLGPIVLRPRAVFGPRTSRSCHAW